MKSYRRRLSWYLMLVVGLVIGVTLVQRWDDVKLRLTHLGGYTTLTNNPLLPGNNADFKASDATQSRIFLQDLLSGGPPKDGIPALLQPAIDTPAQSPFADDALVLGLVINGQAKAYPYGILNWHEIVNDTVGGVPVSVTYCPLCETGIVFERRVADIEPHFWCQRQAVSVLPGDVRPAYQLAMEPALGHGRGRYSDQSELKRYPTVRTTLDLWKKVHPDTGVLSKKTGFDQNYMTYLYGNYYSDDALIFPVWPVERVRGSIKAIESYFWRANNETPHNQFAGVSAHFSWQQVQQTGRMVQMVDGHVIKARWDNALQTVQLFENEQPLVASAAFAFVFPAFFE